jgi:hypothetical protein
LDTLIVWDCAQPKVPEDAVGVDGRGVVKQDGFLGRRHVENGRWLGCLVALETLMCATVCRLSVCCRSRRVCTKFTVTHVYVCCCACYPTA